LEEVRKRKGGIMEYVEPKIKDKIFHQGKLTTIEGFGDDEGTRLRSGQWVCISDFEKGSDSIWRKTAEPTVYEIGQPYKSIDLREGVIVIRPAVFEGGKNPKVITTSPCCVLFSRRLDFEDLMSSVAAKNGGWPERCTQCTWNFRLTLAYQGSPRTGMYGVRWESRGF
jgi:hypothetical protein